MADRYVTAVRPTAHWADDAPMIPALTVFEAEDRPEPTGLLDPQGAPIYRVRERIKMGFHR